MKKRIIQIMTCKLEETEFPWATFKVAISKLYIKNLKTDIIKGCDEKSWVVL